MNTIIAPSILSCDFTKVAEELSYFQGMDDLWFHLDVMDGHFVPNLTFGGPLISKLAKVAPGKLDCHLMVTNPEFYVENYRKYNLHNITFHLEASDDPEELLKKCKSYYPSAGITLRPSTNLSRLSDELIKAADLILLMTVEPGFGGQSFIENSWERLTTLKMRLQRLGIKDKIIQVDGGVNEKNCKRLIALGANNLVAGSHIFKNSPEKYKEIALALRGPHD